MPKDPRPLMTPELRALVDAATAIELPATPPPWPAEGQSHPAWLVEVAESRSAHESPSPAGPAPVLDPAARMESVPVDGGAIDIRIHPAPGGTAGPTPAVVHFHGGGWWIGGGLHGLHSGDAGCRLMADRVGAVVVNVDYREAPEHRFPIPLEDCYAALTWVVDHAAELGVDTGRIVVAGASAGGNLAASVCQLARRRGGPAIVHQLLWVPATDATLSAPSHDENGTGTDMPAHIVDLCWDYYLGPDGDRKDPLVSPLHAELHDLPPAHVAVGEFDPLRDEGLAYAERLRDAGVPVTVGRYPMTHGVVTADVGQVYLDEGLAAVVAATHR